MISVVSDDACSDEYATLVPSTCLKRKHKVKLISEMIEFGELLYHFSYKTMISAFIEQELITRIYTSCSSSDLTDFNLL